MTISISSEAQKNHGWTKGQRELVNKSSVVIRKRNKDIRIYDRITKPFFAV